MVWIFARFTVRFTVPSKMRRLPVHARDASPVKRLRARNTVGGMHEKTLLECLQLYNTNEILRMMSEPPTTNKSVRKKSCKARRHVVRAKWEGRVSGIWETRSSWCFALALARLHFGRPHGLKQVWRTGGGRVDSLPQGRNRKRKHFRL